MGPFALVSYCASAVAFFTLLVVSLTRWRGRMYSGRLVFVCVASIAWSLTLAWHAYTGTGDWTLASLYLAEVIRAAAWFGLLMAAIGAETGSGVPTRMRLTVHGLWLGALVFGFMRGIFWPGGATPENAADAFRLGAFVISMAGLVLVEQLYRNSDPERRWAVKYMCLGAGGMFAYDLCIYALGMLFQALDVNLWTARGAINAMIVPLIAIALARNPDGDSAMVVSRRFAFYTTSLAAAGVYLLAMAGGGYYIRIYGGDWGAVAQAIFLFGAFLILLITMFSGQVRARLRVFLSKHFYSYKYDYREEWLRLIDILFGAGRSALPQRAIRAVAEIVESPSGGLWLATDGREYLPVAGDLAGPDSRTVSADAPIISYLSTTQWIIDVEEYRAGVDRYGDLRLPDWLLEQRRVWLVIPLLQGEALLGFMLLAKPRAAHTLTWEDFDLLKTVGRQVAGVLAQHAAAQKLTETRQFETYNQLSAFIMHDLKNLIAQQSLVVRNAVRHKDNPEFIDDAIQTVDNSVRRMNRLLEQLRRRDEDAAPRRSSLHKLCRDAVAHCGTRQPQAILEAGGEDAGVLVEAERLTLVLGHVIRNAQDAAGPQGVVRIGVRRDGDFSVIDVSDNGCGMDEIFVRERLFRPFDSTKGSKGMGIGAYQTREFARVAGGEVVVESSVGKGTKFSIWLPFAQVPDAKQEFKSTGVAS